MDTTALVWNEMLLCIWRHVSSATLSHRYTTEYLHILLAKRKRNFTCVIMSADICRWVENRFTQNVSGEKRSPCFVAATLTTSKGSGRCQTRAVPARVAALGALGEGGLRRAPRQHMQQSLCIARCRCCAAFVLHSPSLPS